MKMKWGAHYQVLNISPTEFYFIFICKPLLVHVYVVVVVVCCHCSRNL